MISAMINGDVFSACWTTQSRVDTSDQVSISIKNRLNPLPLDHASHIAAETYRPSTAYIANEFDIDSHCLGLLSLYVDSACVHLRLLFSLTNCCFPVSTKLLASDTCTVLNVRSYYFCSWIREPEGLCIMASHSSERFLVVPPLDIDW